MKEEFWSHDIRVNLVPLQANRRAGYKQNCIILTSRETGTAKELIYIGHEFNILLQRPKRAASDKQRCVRVECLR